MNPEDDALYSAESAEDWELPGNGFAPDEDGIALTKAIGLHLEKSEPVALPQDFRAGVLRATARARLRRDLLLVAQVGFTTALLVTGVVAYALGADWWQWLAAALRPEAATALANSVLGSLSAAANWLSSVIASAKPLLPLIPWLLLAASLFVALVELAFFQFLRVGPFHRSTSPKALS
jgi:hypothetical protein